MLEIENLCPDRDDIATVDRVFIEQKLVVKVHGVDQKGTKFSIFSLRSCRYTRRFSFVALLPIKSHLFETAMKLKLFSWATTNGQFLSLQLHAIPHYF